MKLRLLVGALTMSSACTGLVAWVRWNALSAAGAPDRIGVAPLWPHSPPISGDSLANAEDAIVSNDPFRLSNSPSAVRYDPASDAAVSNGLAIPAQPRPSLVLKAIVGGPPWQAVIDGIPGQPPGTIARAGSKFDRLTIRSVTRDSVVVQGMDTSWVLSFRAR
jgi:hypothetical protein